MFGFQIGKLSYIYKNSSDISIYAFSFFVFFTAASLSKFPTVYDNLGGLYSLDNIPTEIQPHHFFIINLSKEKERGTHWISVHRQVGGFIELFDSLGFDQRKRSLYETYLPFVQFETNITPVQCQDSSLCGQFCLFYIVERFLHFDESLNEFLSDRFTLNCASNEKLVTDFCLKNGIPI